MLAKFKQSLNELKSIKNLSLIAVFMSIWIILVLMVVEVSSFISISFEFIAVCLTGAMFGPFVGAIFGFFGDILAYMVHPVGAFYIFYAISVMVDGLIYGLILYKNKYGVKRVVISQITRDVITNLFLNTIFIHMQNGGNLLHIFLFMRLPKNIVKIPVNCIIMVLVTKIVEKRIKKSNI